MMEGLGVSGRGYFLFLLYTREYIMSENTRKVNLVNLVDFVWGSLYILLSWLF